jgi:hypothetical protein
MVRFVLRHGLVRLVGGRAVPALYIWDIVILADRTRRIPIVDRGLRRGAGAVRRGLGAAFAGRPRSARDGDAGRRDRDSNG